MQSNYGPDSFLIHEPGSSWKKMERAGAHDERESPLRYS